jgi:hypothetical protein
LRRIQQVEVAEIGDLHPALALLLAQLHEQGRVDGRVPGAHDEVGVLDQIDRFGRAVGQLRRRRHEFAHGGAARRRDARNGVGHPSVEARVGQQHDLFARTDGEDAVHVGDRLEVMAQPGRGGLLGRRHGGGGGRSEDVL